MQIVKVKHLPSITYKQVLDELLRLGMKSDISSYLTNIYKTTLNADDIKSLEDKLIARLKELEYSINKNIELSDVKSVESEKRFNDKLEAIDKCFSDRLNNTTPPELSKYIKSVDERLIKSEERFNDKLERTRDEIFSKFDVLLSKFDLTVKFGMWIFGIMVAILSPVMLPPIIQFITLVISKIANIFA
ncbi:hypothetical protein bcCo53_001267 (plasmid) [Borrelia coriaceae]|uniref:BDR-repeat family protein n=1 Tax=Borrelia coriaceae ATCC 43381 TaxID=1408429 RepID=W5SWF8_9SPIR|nr:hypothetical protein [Borrelia coriaceae]AHH11222.1 hypothetical protein BCO_0900056 [Borrelia coriaceae ATCC 43381]UPA17098.1 hypothetical protein bcCo53_001267 [Borrelia coriaceae]